MTFARFTRTGSFFYRVRLFWNDGPGRRTQERKSNLGRSRSPFEASFQKSRTFFYRFECASRSTRCLQSHTVWLKL